jgi:hypothetical protein
MAVAHDNWAAVQRVLPPRALFAPPESADPFATPQPRRRAAAAPGNSQARGAPACPGTQPC